jgi:hypothetical protein
MPTFKIKDLMIHVLPSEAELAERCGQVTLRTVGCRATVCHISEFRACDADAGCTCTFDSPGCRSVSCQSPGLQLEYLAILKTELRRTLTRLEIEERALEEEMRPRTAEHVDQAERLLTEALDDLRQQRSGLSQGSGEEEAPKGSA